MRTAFRVPVDSLPLTDFAPLQSPEAVHDVALLDDQFSTAELPCTMALGVAVSVSVGGGITGVTLTVTACDALPPAPEQLSV